METPTAGLNNTTLEVFTLPTVYGVVYIITPLAQKYLA